MASERPRFCYAPKAPPRSEVFWAESGDAGRSIHLAVNDVEEPDVREKVVTICRVIVYCVNDGVGLARNGHCCVRLRDREDGFGSIY